MNRIEQRIAEAQKLGFKKIIVPEFNKNQLAKTNWKIEVIGVQKVEDAFRLLFA